LKDDVGSVSPSRDAGPSPVNSDGAAPRVTTIGGGHGQSLVLRALRHLHCSISAVVATADDGGCSGELRREYGMPAPGDLRRCLAALALESDDLSRLLEERIATLGGIERCRGNLVLAERYLESGSLQAAADWVNAGLSCVGRVFPASEELGTLVVCDRQLGLVEGELNVERTVAAPLIAAVTGAYRPNLEAVRAIEESDAIIMGPGSFYTSTISALVTGEVGAAVCRSSGRRLLILNLTEEERLCAGYAAHDYAVVLASHLTICSRGETPTFGMLRNGMRQSRQALEDGVTMYDADIAADDGVHHSELKLARAFQWILGLSQRNVPELPVMQSTEVRRSELHLALSNAHELALQLRDLKAAAITAAQTQ
jgi:uncharacterized cofD-like protein